MNKKQKRTLKILFSILILVTISTFGIFKYSQNNFSVNGVNIRGSSIEKGADKINSEVAKYETSVQLNDGKTVKISNKDLFTIKPEQITSYKKHDNIILFQDDALEKIEKELREIKEPNIQKRENASIIKTDEGFEIKPEVNGTDINYDEMITYFKTNLRNYNIVITLSEFHQKADITSKDENLQKQLKSLEFKTNKDILIKALGKEENLSKDFLTSIIDVKGNIDQKAASAYFNDLNNKFGTANNKTVKFKTQAGKDIELPNSAGVGSYIDVESAVSELNKAIQSKEESITLDLKSQGVKSEKDFPIGKSYVEIDLTKQHQWVVIDGVVKAESDVMTGREDIGSGTDVGVHDILYKERNAVLRGFNLDGSRYASPVKYWVPFTWPGQGIHDSDWQPEFVYGNNSYNKGYGSHGCVNTPPDKMEKIFNLVEQGMPVVVYN